MMKPLGQNKAVSQFLLKPDKLLKQLSERYASQHRAEATVLMKTEPNRYILEPFSFKSAAVGGWHYAR